MNVLLLGGGGREHAIAWKLRQSSLLTNLHVAPGNAGTAQIAHNLPLTIPATATEPAEWRYLNEKVKEIAKAVKADLIIPSQEDLLANGLTDYLTEFGFAVFGPTRAAAKIEASKIFSHEFMGRWKIPTPEGWPYERYIEAVHLVNQAIFPLVLKADGLAAGKGVQILHDLYDALESVKSYMLNGKFGEAGKKVLLQRFYKGREVSLAAFTDGYDAIHLPTACDYKTFHEGGANTGGVGAYSPAAWLDTDLVGKMNFEIAAKAIFGLADEGKPFRGVLYPGVMVGDEGPKVLEFNCRLGDPETQALLPRMQGDLLAVMLACVSGERKLLQVPVSWDQRPTVCIVLCSEGYPGPLKKINVPITGLENVPEDVLVFHAGTKLQDGRVVTNGGRVLSIVCSGTTLDQARNKAYAAVEKIHFDGMVYRENIGLLN